MPRDYRVFLDDVLEAIANVTQFVGAMTRQEFEADKKTVHAVVRNLEVIGEAVKGVPAGVRTAIHRFPGSGSLDCATFSSIITSRSRLTSFGMSCRASFLN